MLYKDGIADLVQIDEMSLTYPGFKSTFQVHLLISISSRQIVLFWSLIVVVSCTELLKVLLHRFPKVFESIFLFLLYGPMLVSNFYVYWVYILQFYILFIKVISCQVFILHVKY